MGIDKKHILQDRHYYWVKYCGIWYPAYIFFLDKEPDFYLAGPFKEELPLYEIEEIGDEIIYSENNS